MARFEQQASGNLRVPPDGLVEPGAPKALGEHARPHPGRDAAHGAIVGALLLAPGISVATMAVVFGFYTSMLAMIRDLASPRWRSALRMLVPFAAAALVALVLASRLLGWAEDAYPYQMMFLFLGLVVGALPAIVRGAEPGARVRHWWLLVAGAAAVIALSHLPEPNPAIGDHAEFALNPALAVLLALAGVLAGVAVLLPGLSAALMLLVLGVYSTLLTAMRELNLPVLAVVALGAVLGLVVASRGIAFLLARHGPATMMAILGMVAGSAYALVRGLPRTSGRTWSAIAGFAAQPAGTIVAASLALVAGVAAVLLLDRRAA